MAVLAAIIKFAELACGLGNGIALLLFVDDTDPFPLPSMPFGQFLHPKITTPRL